MYGTAGLAINVLLIGCGGLNASTADAPGSNTIDASAQFDASVIDGPVKVSCASMAPFGAWESLGLDEVRYTFVAGHPSADELSFYFSARDGASTRTDSELFVSRRASVSDVFGAPSLLTQLNSTLFDANPSISADGKSLWFESDRGGTLAVYVATRTSLLGEFGIPEAADGINLNGTVNVQPFFTSDNGELWFTSNRTPNLGATDVWRARVVGTGFMQPDHFESLSSDTGDFLPRLSADQLTIYVSSQRSGGKGEFDIWRGQRSTVNDGFLSLRPVAELNSVGEDQAYWISTDNCRIYGRHQGKYVVAKRQP
jgi:hypothetical protein